MSGSPQLNTTLLSSYLMRLGRNTKITAAMHIEVDQVAFNIHAQKDKVLITTSKISDAGYVLRKAVLPVLHNRTEMGAIEAALDRMNLTVYVQNRFLGIMGPKANRVLRKIFYAYVARISLQQV